MADTTREATEQALQQEDASSLAAAASIDELQRLKAAEELFELRYRRRRRRSRLAIAGQSLVGFVAIAGFFTNAYQSYVNKQQQQQQRAIDQERWSKEFARASQADKYRAFFETSVLATDPTNADKRLVGYALLQEFVQDRDYTQKAMIMLEESLSQELRSNTDPGLDPAHRAAVSAILTALSGTADCRALERAARSIDLVAKRHARFKDAEEAGAVLQVYVRRLLGRAAEVCHDPRDFRAVRRPIRDTVVKAPQLLGLPSPSTPERVDARMAELLCDWCLDEVAVSGATDCPDSLRGYAALCQKLPPTDLGEDRAGCERVQAAVSQLSPAGPAPAATPAR